MLIYYLEVHGDAAKSKAFLREPLDRRIGILKGIIEKVGMAKAQRKLLLDTLSRFKELAHKRNLVCHNPYMTIADRGGEHHGGAIFGALTSVQSSGDEIAVANVSDLRSFDDGAARVEADLHQFFPVFQAALPPKK